MLGVICLPSCHGLGRAEARNYNESVFLNRKMRPEKSETPPPPPPPPLPPPPQPSTPEAKPLIQNPEKQSKKISSTTDKSTNPLRGNLHRRAQSETTFRYGNELDLLVDPGDTSLDDELFSSFINVEQFRPKAEDLGADDRSIMAKGASETVETKKAMSSEELAELAVVDPKRAKRILANRQSAARSKERKARYISDLERKVQTLQTEATTLSAQLTLFQRDTTALNAENTELKIRLQSMEQQAQLQDALNEALKQEVQRLKVATGQVNSSSETFNSFEHSLDYNTSFFTLVPQKGPTINPPHPITLPNSSNSSNHKLHPPSKNVSGTTQQDQLDQFEGLDIGNGSILHMVKSESSSISASGSSNTF